MVVALLGIWKAGGAYVPLDPAYPVERLLLMIQDAQLRVLVTDENCRGLFSLVDEVTYLDSEWPIVAQEPGRNPNPVASALNLAYVMYTSGSTGKPKGAMILHRGLVNYLWWAIRTYEVTPDCSAPVHTSIAFDLTVTSLYPPLLAGGRVDLLPEDIGAQNLVAALLRPGGRRLVKITPAHLELLNQQITPQQAIGLPLTFVIGGENLLADTLRIWRNSPTRLFNEYGPTETVVGCCVYEVQLADSLSGSVPIGRPIANTQLYVVDSNLHPLPAGVKGELYIGGVGVARGYLNRPELNAERFLPDPFGVVPGARLYKTGDLARYRADGTLEFLGRTDDQVKIRGYRIELSEIEATLASLPKIASCAVLAREDEPGNKRLVGYVVSREGVVVDSGDLRAYLKERLPEYMVPTHFVQLESFPLTINGKIDRKALPPPFRKISDEEAVPRTETAKVVTKIWSELFLDDQIGVHDDFFDLGGDSLKAVALAMRLRDAFGIDLNLASLFESPTIDKLSQAIDVLIVSNGGLISDIGSAQREEFDF
jgi:amino acid adenylation domain-containing protein